MTETVGDVPQLRLDHRGRVAVPRAYGHARPVICPLSAGSAS